MRKIGLWWVWLVLGAIVQASSVPSTKIAKGVIFDCTQIVNNLLYNNKSAETADDAPLLRKALAESSVVYYKWSQPLESLSVETFVKIGKLVESSGGDNNLSVLWSVGVPTDLVINLTRVAAAGYGSFAHQGTNNTNETTQTHAQLDGMLEVLKAQLNNQTRLEVTFLISWDFDIPWRADRSPSCEPIAPSYGFLKELSTAKHPSGLEYSQSQLFSHIIHDCYYRHSAKHPIQQIPLLVISVELVVDYRFPESYDLFTRLELLLNRLISNFQRYNHFNATTLIFRLKLKPSERDGDRNVEVWSAYAALLARFAYRWTTENNTAALIIPATHSTISNYKGKVEDFIPTMKGHVFPIVGIDNSNSSCLADKIISISPELASLIATRFNTIYIELSFDKELLSSQDCMRNNISPTQNSQRSNFSVLRDNDLKLVISIGLSRGDTHPEKGDQRERVEKTLIKSVDALKSFIVATDAPIQAILLSDQIPPRIFTKVFSTLKNVSEQVGCIIKFDNNTFNPGIVNNSLKFESVVAERCIKTVHGSPELNNNISVLVLDIREMLDVKSLKGFGFGYSNHIQSQLIRIHNWVSGFTQEKKFEWIKVVYQLPVGSTIERGDAFCNADARLHNAIVEAFVTWSYIHNVTIILNDVVSPGFGRSGWWERLEDKSNTAGDHPPIFVTRNYPPTMSYLKQDPCLERKLALPKSRIALDATVMGCSLDLSGGGGVIRNSSSQLSQAAIEVMLEYALHKFSNVEILGSNPTELTAPLETTLLNSDNQSTILLDLSLGNGEMDTLLVQLAQISKLAHKLISANKFGPRINVQISNFEEHLGKADFLQNLQTFVQAAVDAGMSPGIVIANSRRNNNMAVSGGKLEEEDDVLRKVVASLKWSYVVIDAKLGNVIYGNVRDFRGLTISPRFFATMGSALDDLYVLKTNFNRAFPEKQVYIRLEFHDDAGSTAENFLLTVRALNEHGKSYGMKYFAINAFKSSPFSQNYSKQGWWRLDNTSDFSNVHYYTELESEYIGKPILWRPAPRERGLEVRTTGTNWLAIVLSACLVLFIIGFILFAVRKRTQIRILSRVEEEEFLNGVVSHGEHHDLDENQFLNMKFDKSFEITKINLNSEGNALIGTGNFGLVYKACIREGWAALKIPKEGTGPGLFRTVLQEIKIMCYVGHHENVIRFVGAYVREIGRGVVQVATELCENGTLLSHLRGMARSIAGTERSGSGSLYNLVTPFNLERYCLEIASGMEYLSSKRVIHGDLATRNVLLNEHFTCKIGDFGLSRKLYEYEKYVKESQEPLPWRWLAYETLDKMEFSTKSDVWSFGITLWEIYSLGSVPYPGLNWSIDFVQNLNSGMRLQKPKYSTNDLFERMSQCWKLEAEARPNFSELCEYFRTFQESQYTAVEEISEYSSMENAD